jgi:hypothetical protein
MNLTRIIDIKERIAISNDWKPDERDFILECINTAVEKARNEQRRVDMHDAPNYLGRIEQPWAYLSIDEGGEGVCAMPMGNLTVAMVAADRRRVDDLVPFARGIAKAFGKPVKRVKFSQRTDEEVYQP